MFMIKVGSSKNDTELLEFYTNKAQARVRLQEIFNEVKSICESNYNIYTKVVNDHLIEIVDFESNDTYYWYFSLTQIEVDKAFDVEKTLFFKDAQ